MNKFLAFEKIDTYFDSWKKNNVFNFLGTMCEDITIYDFQGHIHKSMPSSEQWFVEWHGSGNRLMKWDIHRYFFDPLKESVFVQWSIHAVVAEEEIIYEGASAFGFKEGKIFEIKEFIMINDSHDLSDT